MNWRQLIESRLGMETRKHVHEEEFPVSPEKLFALLHTPSAICEWWGAASAIVIPKKNGIWAAVWGEDTDAPDYTSVFTIAEFEPPRRMLLTDARYIAKAGQPPFEAKMTAEFIVTETGSGSALRVIQDGFPADPVADDFYAACDTGWRNTFAGIRKYLS